MVDWKEKINIRLLDFEGWPDWVAGPNGWLIRYCPSGPEDEEEGGEGLVILAGVLGSVESRWSAISLCITSKLTQENHSAAL